MTLPVAPPPVIVTPLFPPMWSALLTLLRSLSPAEWRLPTPCAGWSVQDVALHLWGGDVGILSRQRDGQRLAGGPIQDWDELVTLINRLNAEWLAAARRISPRLLCDLLELTSPQVSDYFAALDPLASGALVSWAGPEPAPVWLDLAREYTERWHHQQHIREAVGQPGLNEPQFVTPALATFLHALPHTMRAVTAPTGTCIAVTITGDAGFRWGLVRAEQGWGLTIRVPATPHAEVEVDQESAWRLFTKGRTPSAVASQAMLRGDVTLGERLLHTVAIIA